MPEYLTPGVCIEELQTGNQPIEGVSTSTVGFLGIAERGTPATRLITSYSDFSRAYGEAGVSVASMVLGNPTIAAGGAGYTDGGGNGVFQATLVGGTLVAGGTAATVDVTLTNGVVTAVTLVNGGGYSVPPSNPAAITGLAGGAAAMIGFLASNGQHYLAYAVEGFFQNGGQRCFVQTVTSSTAVPASQASAQMSIVAVNGGAWGSRVAVKIEAGSTSGFRLTAMYWTQTPPNAAATHIVTVDPTSRQPADLRNANRREPQVIEVFDNLDVNPLSTSFFGVQINGVSNLITVSQVGAGNPANQQLTLLTGGTDGNALVLADFLGNPNLPPGQKTGLDAFTEIDEISLLCCPDAYALGGADAINDALIDQCEVLQSRFAILNSRPNQLIPFTVSFNSRYAAFYYPWVNVINPLTDTTLLIPPCGHIAGIYARSDDARGVQKDPANEVIRGIDSLQFNLTDAQQALLNPVGINCLRYFRGAGNLVWGGRTTSIDPQWRYINVRRLFIFIEQSILRSTRWAVFEINDEPVWAQIRRSIGDFLTRLWMDDMLQGATKDQAYFVRCDRTTMTQADIDNGRLICVIGIAPVKPAEFVIFRIGQWAGGSSVNE
jgi:phage tail sheath protein FI